MADPGPVPKSIIDFGEKSGNLCCKWFMTTVAAAYVIGNLTARYAADSLGPYVRIWGSINGWCILVSLNIKNNIYIEIKKRR